jgi:uncharacterized membrane protein
MEDKQAEELLARIEKLSAEIELLKSDVSELKRARPQTTNHRPQATRTYSQIFDLENFIGLKLIHFIGIIVLIIGLTIGVKYAIDIDLVSPLVRISSAYLASAALVFISFRLRAKYEVFSLILFSGAMVSLYFTTYAAFEYYGLLPRWLAFALMLLVTAFTVYTSLSYNRKEIAMLGLVGAYGIPFFVGKNSGDISSLFSYILLINAGVLVISFRKYWVSMGYLAFFTTWIIFYSVLFVRPGGDYFNTELLFAFIFFTVFLLNCLGFKFIKKQALDISDTFIVIMNTALLYFSLAILYNTATAGYMENITLLFGIVYLAAGIISRKWLPAQKHFSNAIFSVSLTAFVVYVPMKYDGLGVTITWVIMAILYFVTGIFYRVKSFRIMSILLFAATLFKLLVVDSSSFTSIEKIIAYVFTGVVLLIVSFLYQKFGARIFIDEEG